MTKSQPDACYLKKWVGKTMRDADVIDRRQTKLMQTITGDALACLESDELPPLWHWLYFPTLSPLENLGPDGHPQRGSFLPPVDLPRRMWAGGRLEFIRSIMIGEEVDKKSVVKSVRVKKGKTGALCFVTVQHEYVSRGNLCLREEHDIVYRERPVPGPRSTRVQDPTGTSDWNKVISPDPVMLFRYSALTFNGHKIHYDREYCQKVEGYEGLVFHGPLTATLLIAMAVEKNPGKKLRTFEFRAIAPLFDTAPFTISGRNENAETALWAQTPEGNLAMQANATWDI